MSKFETWQLRAVQPNLPVEEEKKLRKELLFGEHQTDVSKMSQDYLNSGYMREAWQAAEIIAGSLCAGFTRAEVPPAYRTQLQKRALGICKRIYSNETSYDRVKVTDQEIDRVTIAAARENPGCDQAAAMKRAWLTVSQPSFLDRLAGINANDFDDDFGEFGF